MALRGKGGAFFSPSSLAGIRPLMIITTPYRHGNKEKAEVFFLDGMTKAMHQLAKTVHPTFPVTVYYAFKLKFDS
jgi:hypothetical protein